MMERYLFQVLGMAMICLASCATDYSQVIETTENAYYNEDYNTAIPAIRDLYESSSSKDRLLFLMEAGTIFRTKGDFETSIKVFKEAESIADNIKQSLSKSGLSFLLSDNESNYIGEDFERVMIKYFIALNYLSLGDLENAKIYFRRLDFDLKEMKFLAPDYRQNNAARLLDAYISENLGRYNDARVQYKNLEQLLSKSPMLMTDRYVLAAKEGDSKDQSKYMQGSTLVPAYDKSINRINYSPNSKLGELIIVHEAGKSAIKFSRGKLIDDEYFLVTLRVAIEVALRTEGAGVSATGVLATLSTAENPIPIYKERDLYSSTIRHFYLNGVDIGSGEVLNNYSDTAIQNYNDNYKAIVTKNVSSIAVKIVAATIASEAAARAIEERVGKGQNDLVSALIRLGSGAVAGLATAQTISPDLRCWRTIPANFQIKRIFLEPGNYQFSVDKTGMRSSYSPNVQIEAGKPTILTVRSYSN